MIITEEIEIPMANAHPIVCFATFDFTHTEADPDSGVEEGLELNRCYWGNDERNTIDWPESAIREKIINILNNRSDYQ